MSTLTPAQCRAARGFLLWSQPTLAYRAGITLNQIRAFERPEQVYKWGRRVNPTTGAKITTAFAKAGIILVFGGVIPAVGAKEMPADVMRAEIPIQ